jgi:hypothetical protein
MADQHFVEDVLNLPDGACVLRTPAVLSQESVEDVGDWLELILRSIKRATASHREAERQGR